MKCPVCRWAAGLHPAFDSSAMAELQPYCRDHEGHEFFQRPLVVRAPGYVPTSFAADGWGNAKMKHYPVVDPNRKGGGW